MDNDFTDLFPNRGQPAIQPWKLALITILQFGENLSDRQAVNVVRTRIDWKYLLGVQLDDAGFDFSILSEFRKKLLSCGAEERLFSKILEYCKREGLIKERGAQRTDSTGVIAFVRSLARIELVA
jgi:transposase